MKTQTDIQELIPETHRDLVKAIPRGFAQSALVSGIIMGALFGTLLTYILPKWLAAGLIIALLVGHVVHKRKSDAMFDERMAALGGRGFDWAGEDES